MTAEVHAEIGEGTWHRLLALTPGARDLWVTLYFEAFRTKATYSTPLPLCDPTALRELVNEGDIELEEGRRYRHRGVMAARDRAANRQRTGGNSSVATRIAKYGSANPRANRKVKHREVSSASSGNVNQREVGEVAGSDVNHRETTPPPGGVGAGGAPEGGAPPPGFREQMAANGLDIDVIGNGRRALPSGPTRALDGATPEAEAQASEAEEAR